MHDFQDSKNFDSEIKGLLRFLFLISMSSILRSSLLASRVFSCNLAGSSRYLPRWCKFHLANWLCFSTLALDLVIGFEICGCPRSVADGLRSSAVPPPASSFATTGCETSAMSFGAPFSPFFQCSRYCWPRFLPAVFDHTNLISEGLPRMVPFRLSALHRVRNVKHSTQFSYVFAKVLVTKFRRAAWSPRETWWNMLEFWQCYIWQHIFQLLCIIELLHFQPLNTCAVTVRTKRYIRFWSQWWIMMHCGLLAQDLALLTF